MAASISASFYAMPEAFFITASALVARPLPFPPSIMKSASEPERAVTGIPGDHRQRFSLFRFRISGTLIDGNGFYGLRFVFRDRKPGGQVPPAATMRIRMTARTIFSSIFIACTSCRI
jgi:hypothetical protein